jgi:hypothetical protein
LNNFKLSHSQVYPSSKSSSNILRPAFMMLRICSMTMSLSGRPSLSSLARTDHCS